MFTPYCHAGTGRRCDHHELGIRRYGSAVRGNPPPGLISHKVKCDRRCENRCEEKENGHQFDARNYLNLLAPQVRLELTTLRLTAECSAIELLRNMARLRGGDEPKE